MRRRLLVIGALVLISVPAVIRLAVLASLSPASGAVGLAGLAIILAVVVLNGRRVIARRAAFMDGLRSSGATVVVHGMARADALGRPGRSRSVPLTVAASSDRIDLWRMPVFAGEPELVRSTPWAEVASVEVGDASLSMTPGRGLVVVETSGRRVPVMILAQGAVGSRLDPSDAVASCQRLLHDAPPSMDAHAR